MRLKAVVASATLVASLFSVVIGPARTARADLVEQTPGAEWPFRVYGASGGSDGTALYTFGGIECASTCGPTDKIARYDPGSNRAEVLAARLPSANWLSASVWTGSVFIIFGGTTPNRVVTFDPAAGVVTNLGNIMPAGRNSVSAVWDGTAAYLFGGYDPAGNSTTVDTILRFDPTTRSFTTMAARLPVPASATAAVWTNSGAIILGGSLGNRIVRYTPSSDTATVLGSTLPHERSSPSVYWKGSSVYVIGGCCDPATNYGATSILKFDPALDALTTEAQTMPRALTWATGGLIGDVAFIAGGGTVSEVSLRIHGYNVVTKEILSTKGLPFRLGSSGVAWSSGKIWIVGGSLNGGPVLDRAIRFDPQTGFSVIKPTRMSPGRSNMGSAFDGRYMYLFGGSSGDTRLDEIVRYDIETDTYTTMNSRLPAPLMSPSAVFAGTEIYILGGLVPPPPDATYPVATKQILRYDPASDALQVMSSRLPDARYNATSVFNGSKVLTFGGASEADGRVVVVLDPASGGVTTGGQLPLNAFGGSAVFQRGYVYIAGSGGLNDADRMQRYSPSTGGTIVMSAVLPRSGSGIRLVGDGSGFYVLGGCCIGGYYSEDVHRYTLIPGAPDVTGTPGPARGQVTIAWTPPASNSHSSEVLDYRVYEGSSAGGESLVAILPATATSFSQQGLLDGEVRFFRVRARNEMGEGDLSPSLPVRAMVLPGPPTAPRATTGPGAGVITLRWNPPSETGGGAFVYKVYSSGASSDVKALIGTTSQTTMTHSGLGNGVTRYYQISAENVVGEGPLSVEAVGTTADRPGAPAYIQSQTFVSGVFISWVEPSFDGGSPITSYRLYRSTTIFPRQLVAVISPWDRYYVDTRCFTICSYDVTANNLVGEGPRSATVTGVGANPL